MNNVSRETFYCAKSVFGRKGYNMCKRNVHVNLFRGDEVILVNRLTGIRNIKRLDIHDCYNRPSRCKVSVYEKWVEWLRDYHVGDLYGIQSYNGFRFTFGAYVKLPVFNTGSNRIYYLYVTHTRSELTPTLHYDTDNDMHDIDYNEFKYLEKLYHI